MLTLVRKPLAVMLVPLWSPTNSPDSNPRSELIPSSSLAITDARKGTRGIVLRYIRTSVCAFVISFYEPFPVISYAFLARLTPFGSIANSLLRHRSNHDRAREE